MLPMLKTENIPQIIERLSMSCVASFEEWSNIFRNRSFTLFKNDRDFRERFDSVTVSESVSSSSMQICLCAEWTNRLVVHLQVSPFLLPALHQISTLEKTTCRQCSNQSSLMSWRLSEVSLSLVAAHSTRSEVLPDFQIWFSPGFPMQWRQARSDSSRCVVRPNSSSALILL